MLGWGHIYLRVNTDLNKITSYDERWDAEAKTNRKYHSHERKVGDEFEDVIGSLISILCECEWVCCVIGDLKRVESNVWSPISPHCYCHSRDVSWKKSSCSVVTSANNPRQLKRNTLISKTISRQNTERTNVWQETAISTLARLSWDQILIRHFSLQLTIWCQQIKH